MNRKDITSLPDAVQSAITDIAKVPPMEAVPAHMMELFTDEQWSMLVFQIQPSLRLVTTTADQAGRPVRRWVVFRTTDETLVRPADDEDYRGLELVSTGADFDQVSRGLWPDRDRRARHKRLTTLLLKWLQEGLIVDAGVPLPDDAEFEVDPDDATRSCASSPKQGKGNR